MKLLVTGASGFVGRHVVTQALEAGHTVATLTRRDWSGGPPVDPARRHFGQLPWDVPPAAFRDADVVVHCAASASSDVALCRAVNTLGTRHLAALARDAGVRAFVFISSQNARADTPSPYGRTKFEAEQALLETAGLQAVILRAGLVAGRGGLFGRLLSSLERWPAMPVIGRESPVQPIYVGDLASAILRAAANAAELDRRVLELGLPEVASLGQVLATLGQLIRRRPPRLVPVPLGAVVALVRAAERAQVPLPINSVNLTGLRTVRPMQTDADMRRLSVPERSLPEVLRLAVHDTAPATIGGDRGASRTLLVGAGRVGIVHAVTLSRQRGAVLAGIVDLNAGARRLVHSTGVAAPGFASLDEALASGAFDAAVIATPPATHLKLARACLARGLATLIEKPACVGPHQLAEYDELLTASQPVALVGYLMPRIPHVQTWLDRLRRGELGTVEGFVGFTLLSFIHAGDSGRWETRKEVSGGGVLANSAGHVLSMIWSAFGPPRSITAQSLRLVSTGVEDSAGVCFDYDGFSGRLLASWSIRGFPRQENRLVITTDRGTLTLVGSMAVWQTRDGEMVLDHQLDADVGFNLAPDYAGAGFAREVLDLAGRTPVDERMTLERGLAVERVLFSIYAGLEERATFELPGPRETAVPSPVAPRLSRAAASAPSVREPARVMDLRDLALPEQAALGQAAARAEWAAALVYPNQVRAAVGAWGAQRVWVTVPNFLHQTRLISDKQYRTLLSAFGGRGLTDAAVVGARAALGERGLGFWVAATGLLAGDLAGVAADFDGTLLLHPYLVDLALALDRLDRLAALLRLVRQRRPRARVGLHSNLARAAANAVSSLREPPDALSLLSSPGSRVVDDARAWLAATERTRQVAVVAEVGPGPRVAHLAAFQNPDAWAHGADHVVISGLADTDVFRAADEHACAHWAAAFRNAPMPRAVW